MKDFRFAPLARQTSGKQSGVDFRFRSPPQVRESVGQSAMRRQTRAERFQSNLDRVDQTIKVQREVRKPSDIQEAEKTQAKNEAVLDEMFLLRNSIGGGLSGSLSELAAGGQESREALQAEMDDAFREELARLMQQASENVDKARNSTAPTEILPPRNIQVPSIEVPNQLRPAQMKDRAVRAGGVAVWNQAQVIKVRKVARMLEELAWELEDVGAYQNADRLRSEAEEMRLKARRDSAPRAMLR